MALDLALRYDRIASGTDHVCTVNTAYRRSALLAAGLAALTAAGLMLRSPGPFGAMSVELAAIVALLGIVLVLATIGMEYLLESANPELGVAATMAALPVLIPLGILLIRRLQASEVQL